MVICCVPNCGADSWKCDGSITFYDFPANPDLAAKWIRQINTAVKTRPMWFPRGKPVICSKHFLHTDFKGDTDSLKPRCVPTVFGHKYIGPNPESYDTSKLNESKTSPLIVKVIRPSNCVTPNDNLQVLVDHSHINADDGNCINDGEPPEVMEIEYNNSQDTSHKTDANNLQVSPQKNNLRNNLHTTNNSGTSYTKATSQKPNNSQQVKNKTSFVKWDNVAKGNSSKQPNPVLKKIAKKREKTNSDLIEIGPNTFLKINPDIIKVNKKQTPSGNTVLQFLMDQKHAKNYSSDMLPKLIQGITPAIQGSNSSDTATVGQSNDDASNKDTVSDPQAKETVQRVLGHIVDTHACEDTCADLQLQNDGDECIILENSQDQTNNASSACKNNNTPDKTDTSFIEKAPVLLTTNMPLSHCFVDKPKYILQLKQKSKQIASLKFKVSTLTKKIEELEDRCIVQERQLSYSFIKRLKSIRKNASKGDPRATYILEQIRSYSSNASKMRWSDTTLTQCAIWCRKAPYAYEYFKKADFFKLPCLGSVKRFMKKHPEIRFQKKVTNSGPQNGGGDNVVDDDESSDFDFDESDGENGNNEASDDDNTEPVKCEAILTVPSERENSTVEKRSSINDKNCMEESNEISKATEIIANHSSQSVQNDINNDTSVEKASNNLKHTESNGIPITVDSSNLELQEIMLPSGEVVQCYSSTIGNSADIGGGQYYIIPNVEQNSSGDHEYSVIQADSLPAVLQNLETSQVHLQQDQLIFIANNSTGQVECSETEVTSA